jgi:glycosyltransferase involved in cell wall biosynthesis
MTPLDIILAVALFFALLALVMTIINLANYHEAPAPVSIEKLRTLTISGTPAISVCIPARNEEANIGPCIESLVAQQGFDDTFNFEILVYNDQSTDATGDIIAALSARDRRLKSVPTKPLPDGWNGKQFGCYTMSQSAQGTWLLFTDADVRFAPDCLIRTLSAAHVAHTRSTTTGPRKPLGLLSTFPRQLTGTLSESLAVPMIFFILFSYLPMPRMRRTMDVSASAACGQFMLAHRDAYAKSGGHSAFKASMHDGVKMPRAIRAAGYHSDLFDSTNLCSVRMYQGLNQTWRGFTKNAFEGLGSVGLLGFITIVHVLAHILPWLMLVGLGIKSFVPDLFTQVSITTATYALTISCVLSAIFQRILLLARFKSPVGLALLHPIAVGFMTIIQWYSYYLQRTGRRAWRGRTATT